MKKIILNIMSFVVVLGSINVAFARAIEFGSESVYGESALSVDQKISNATHLYISDNVVKKMNSKLKLTGVVKNCIYPYDHRTLIDVLICDYQPSLESLKDKKLVLKDFKREEKSTHVEIVNFSDFELVD
ncbi:MAG: hypothetical protein ACK41T_00605 [Pseudobdellovibrio sp.]